MSKVSFVDIESNGLLDTISKVHSIVIKTDDKVGSYHGDSLDDGLQHMMEECDTLVGHNFLCYDIPALERVYGVSIKNKIFDTLVVSRLIYTDMYEQDEGSKKVPKALWGRHSLKSWGYRLGILKGELQNESEDEDIWEKWTPEMQTYCEQDVEVTEALYKHLRKRNYSSEAIEIEHEFQKIIFKQEQNGVLFNTPKAREYAEKVAAEVAIFKETLSKGLPKQATGKTTVCPKRANKKTGAIIGAEYTRFKYEPFNPGSRVQIVKLFQQKYNWKPTVFTKTGQPSLADAVLRALPYEESEGFADLFERTKIQGYLSEGKNSWLNMVHHGRIHGRVNTNGAVTGRCTHSRPNLAQVPSIRKYMGKECRSLFHSGAGLMIGADASGLELRMLAHYLSRYDNGRYTKTLLNSDIHTANQQAAGLETRDQAKTFIYAYLYGAGDAKLGSIYTGTKDEFDNKKAGKRLRSDFLRKTEGLADLVRDVKSAASRGFLLGLDGRHLALRSDYKALNTLLQGAGAVVMKQANIEFWKASRFKDMQQVLNVHDEFEVVTNRPKEADEIGKLMVASIVRAGERFKLRCALDGEYKIGKNWSEVH